jgi:hypothetical protein
MIYLIFTIDGWQQAKDFILEDKAELWINDDVLSDDELSELNAADITVSILPMSVEPNNEKSVMKAVEWVEQHSPNKELLVEFV